MSVGLTALSSCQNAMNFLAFLKEEAEVVWVAVEASEVEVV